MALIFNKEKQTISMLEELVYLAEKGTPTGENFGHFPSGRIGTLLDRLTEIYNKGLVTKEDISIERERVIFQTQENIVRKKQLTQNINHELKTPVSSICGYLETLVSNPNIPPATRELFISKAYSQAKRLSDLLGDLSTLTRMEEGSDKISKEPLNLSEIVKDVVRSIEISVNSSCKIVNNLPDDLSINGNYSLIESIFNNLLENALLYSKGSKVEINLTKRDEKMLYFSVSDNGTGVDPIHLDRIFERFYRVDKGRSRELGGTGLGLSIVKNSVLIHGGKITAENSKPKGLTFNFSLMINN
ncbi:MAG: sensor histidine kinase [Candidatus Coprenecus sp.]